ncbi:MAG: extracellular solute-binding protein [Chloroflexota bacterium]
MQRLVSVLVLCFMLAGCSLPFATPGAESDPNAANGDQVTISYAAWESERPRFEALAQEFTEANPTIQVVIVALDDLMNYDDQSGQDSQMAALRRVVSGADTAPAFFVSPEAYNTNLLMDLQPLMEADPNFQRDDFFAGALERYGSAGGVWVLPRYFYIQLLEYNKTLFEIANVPEPTPGWSWNDLLGVSEQIAQKNGRTIETYGFLDSSGGSLPLYAELVSQGVNILETPSQDIVLNDPAIVSSIERIRELSDSGALYNGLSGFGLETDDTEPVDPAQMVQDGRVGIWPSEMLAYSFFEGEEQNNELNFETGIVPYPTGDGLFDFGGSDGYLISGGTAHPNEAWKWIEFLSRQDIEQDAFEGGGALPGRVPARQSLADELGFWDSFDEATTEAYRWALENDEQNDIPSNFDYRAIAALSDALAQVLNDSNADVQQILTEAQGSLDEELAQVETTPTAEPDMSPVFVATPEPQEAPEGATTITFMNNGYNPSALRQLSRTFQEQRPDIFVEITSTDTFTGPLEFGEMSRMADCFSWWSQPTSDEDLSALLDLQPLLDADSSFDRDDYPAALLSLYEDDGRLTGLPYTYNIRTLSYNRAIFEESGIGTPTYTWTPDDFLASAQSLTTGEGPNKQYGYVAMSGPLSDILFFANQFDAQLTTGSGENTRPNYDDPDVIQTIQWYIDLAEVHEVMPDIELYYRSEETSTDPTEIVDPYQFILEGRAGMWFDWDQGSFGFEGPIAEGEEDVLQVGAAPLPVANGGLSGDDISTRGFHISAQSEHTQACWDWLKFLSTDISNLQGGTPARISVSQSEEYIQQTSPEAAETADIYAEALQQTAQVSAQSASFGNIDTYWLYKAIDNAIKDEMDLDRGLAEAQETTLAFLDCLDQSEDAQPGTCAKEVDPDYDGYSLEFDGPMPAEIEE